MNYLRLAIYAALTVAEGVVGIVDRRKAAKRKAAAEAAKGLSHADVARQQAQIRSAAKPPAK
jgi:hypothetical protein